MIKVTVLYNLPPDADHEAFVKWRSESHQQKLINLPGVLESNFYVIESGRNGPAPYRYMSEILFTNQETFEKVFYDTDFQTGLDEDLKRVADPVFLISRQLLSGKGQNPSKTQPK